MTQAAAEEHIDKWYCHGNGQVSSSLAAYLVVRPPLPVAPHQSSCSRRRTHSGEVSRGSFNKFRPVVEGELVRFSWK